MELISVDALLEQAQCTNAYFQVKSIVAGLPKIDAEPVVHGHWNVERDNGSIMFTCSCCGYGYADIDSVFIDEPHKYCPECGAKMDEEQ